jgi:hypothetical protein
MSEGYKNKVDYLKKITSVFLALTLLIGVMAVFVGQPVGAQTSGGSSGYLVSPVRQELTIEKGQSQKVTLTVENVTQAATTAKALVNDFEASDDETGQPRILLDNSSVSGNSFKSLIGEMADITLGPLQKQQVEIVISVPADAYAGGYYGAIRFVDATTENSQNVALAASVGAIFLVQVPGNLTEAMELVEFTPAKDGSNGRFFIGGDGISIVTRLRNTGNIHVKPFGKVTITDRSGTVVESFEFNNTEPRANVLPDSIRRFEDKLQNQKWFGKYTVTANLGYGTAGSLITATTYFWVVPLWLVIVSAAVILLILVGGYFIYRKIAANKRFRNRIHSR